MKLSVHILQRLKSFRSFIGIFSEPTGRVK